LNEQRFKSDQVYERIPYLVTAKNGSMCTISQDQRSLTRNASLLKKVRSVAFWLPEPNEAAAPAAPLGVPAAPAAPLVVPAVPAAPLVVPVVTPALPVVVPALPAVPQTAPTTSLAVMANPVTTPTPPVVTPPSQQNQSDVEDDSDETLNEPDLEQDSDSSTEQTTSEEEPEELESDTRTTRSRKKPDWYGQRAPPKPQNRKRRQQTDTQPDL
jgi:hypothetical protein